MMHDLVLITLNWLFKNPGRYRAAPARERREGRRAREERRDEGKTEKGRGKDKAAAGRSSIARFFLLGHVNTGRRLRPVLIEYFLYRVVFLSGIKFFECYLVPTGAISRY